MGDVQVGQNLQSCELCGREIQLTSHHLIPRTRHRNKRTQKRFRRDDMQTRILWVCRSCHNHIHNTFSEKELADAYYSKELLLAHPAIKKFIGWIAARPAGFKAR